MLSASLTKLDLTQRLHCYPQTQRIYIYMCVYRFMLLLLLFPFNLSSSSRCCLSSFDVSRGLPQMIIIVIVIIIIVELGQLFGGKLLHVRRSNSLQILPQFPSLLFLLARNPANCQFAAFSVEINSTSANEVCP